MIVDKYNQELKEGDEVIYAMGGQGNTSLIHGFISGLVKDRNGKITEVKVRRLVGGSTATRIGRDLIKFSPIKLAYPEQFI